jgi:hypothetical protein
MDDWEPNRATLEISFRSIPNALKIFNKDPECLLVPGEVAKYKNVFCGGKMLINGAEVDTVVKGISVCIVSSSYCLLPPTFLC